MLLAATLSLLMNTATLPETKESHMDWWREAKFGMFIHWGLYAVPAGEWNGATNHAEWIRDTARIPVDTYEGLLAKFNPVKFDADAWAKMAKDAGMKYVVITSKHHDGFCLYDSKHTDWDVASTPYKKDILRQLADACKRQGIVFCTYHSIMDWHHPDYLPRRPWEAANRPAAGADFKRFVQYLHNQVEEIATAYDPGIMWFDGQWEGTWNTDLGKDLLALCRRVRPNMIVNNRVLSGPQGGGDYLTPEQEIPEDEIKGKDWETCMTLNDHWGYNRADRNTKSTKQVIHMLADIASKGGNYLLNIGPTAEGEFPAESISRLREIGAWMRTNGQSIYGTTASPFGKLPWGRCTVKARGADSTLYLHVFDWPKDGVLVLQGLGNEVQRARLLAGSGSLRYEKKGSDLEIVVPKQSPDELDAVIELHVKGAPLVYKTPLIEADAKQFVHQISVKIDAPGLEVRYTTDGTDPGDKTNRNYKTYSRGFDLRDTTVVKARAFHNGKAVSGVAEARFEKVKPFEPWKVQGTLQPGLELRVFSVTWDKLAEMAFLTEGFTTKTVPTVSIADDPQREFTARFFKGFLEVPETEMYRFALSSDDGSRLWVSRQLVVDNDGLHGAVEKTGAIALEKGKHLIWVEWFNKTGGAQLSLKWSKLGQPLKEVAPSVLLRARS